MTWRRRNADLDDSIRNDDDMVTFGGRRQYKKITTIWCKNKPLVSYDEKQDEVWEIFQSDITKTRKRKRLLLFLWQSARYLTWREFAFYKMRPHKKLFRTLSSPWNLLCLSAVKIIFDVFTVTHCYWLTEPCTFRSYCRRFESTLCITKRKRLQNGLLTFVIRYIQVRVSLGTVSCLNCNS